ncbi:MAG: DUF1707 domain-containing protein [Gemmatimonadales bacterium]|jgi:hypothetical protein
MTEPREPSSHLPAPPIGPDARDRVVEVLTQHFAGDRITEADLEARLERVYAATTGPELEAIIADLPGNVPAVFAGAIPAIPGDGAAVRRIDALLSGQEQRMTGVVPRQLQARGRLGYVELDLTHATFEQGLTTIDVQAFMGYVQVRLPPGLRVECHGRAVAGYFSLKGASRAGGDDALSVVRITGRAAFGYAEVFIAKGGPPRHPGRAD